MNEDAIQAAAEAIRSAGALLMTAGAGMGVDSGLPDFRGPEGFWRAYPAYRHLNLSFSDMANPVWFQRDPEFAWGFYGHRLALYRETRPHAGFAILRRWAEGRSHFVFTSNVDGQYQCAGFDESVIHEVHGAIRWLQCSAPCTPAVWPAGADVVVDEETFRAEEELPTCPHCGIVARPNILMFGDWSYLETREKEQAARFAAFVEAAEDLVIVEVGAGTAIPTVRRAGERLAARGARLIRINPREPEGPAGTIEIAAGGLAGLEAIDAALRQV